MWTIRTIQPRGFAALWGGAAALALMTGGLVACDSGGDTDTPACDPTCEDGFSCVDGTCVDESTICDPACEAGFTCVDQACVAEAPTCDPACEDGFSCVDGSCVADTPTCDPACEDGFSCVDGSCVADTPTCDPACEAGFTCVDGACVDETTICDPACEAGFTCVDNACVDETTICDPACEDGFECVNNACQEKACDPACDAGFTCVQGACVDETTICDPACEDGFTCIDNACVDETSICDPACDPGFECVNNACQEKACDPACDAGFTCVHGVCLDETLKHLDNAMLQGPFADGMAVTAACSGCHPGQATAAHASVHFQFAGPTPGMQGHEADTTVGKNTTINNFCIAIRGNEARCAQCHAGYGYADKNYDFAKEKVDCLVCHAAAGTYKKAPKTAGKPDETVDLALAARSVGPPSRHNCGSCHFYAGGGDNVKKGDLGSWADEPTAEMDVHMGGQGMTCADCHAGADHKVKGSGLHNPVEEEPLSCMDCHQGPLVHQNVADIGGTLDNHLAHVACQTCHIPTFSRTQATKLSWKWSEAGDADRVPVEDEYGKEDYNKLKGEFIWGKNVAPTLAWYNGTFTRMQVGDTYDTTPVDLGSPLGDINDPAAKIFPFKVMVGNQPADTTNKVMAVPHLFGKASGDNPYWAVFDWDLAIQEGMAYAGLDYSGTYDFVDTEMWMELNHEVAPKEQARKCNDCHNGGIDFTALGYTGDPMTVGGEHATN